ncbi:MAG: formate dehydrogenase accessory sulfurtransferase FdhD, partial [Deltaproteobacteria bacterium]
MSKDVDRAAPEGTQREKAQPVLRLAVRAGTGERGPDEVAVEAPLEIRLNGRAISVTMRSPGEDEPLALGFLWGEGILERPDELIGVEQVADDAVDVRVAAAVLARGGWQRNFFASSSCGLCGKASLSLLRAPGGRVAEGPPLSSAVLTGLPERVRAAQPTFARTGGLHAAAWVSPDGTLQQVSEDIGRHNAVDKVVGAALLLGRLPLTGALLFVSGRAGFELVQKAIAAGFGALGAVGAATSLSVALADERGLGLAGFVRDGGFN